MNKLIFLASSLIISTQTFASRDSIAFFYTPKKVSVLINERGTNSRLHDFMDFFNADNDMVLTSKKGDIKLGCARDIDKVSCTFTFLPSENVALDNRELHVLTTLNDFGVESDDSFEMRFRSSMKDNITLTVTDGELVISASKK